MKQLQNNFTTPEQSKRLLELGVPADSADCSIDEWGRVHKIPQENGNLLFSQLKRQTIYTIRPCWSVGRLMEIFLLCTPYKEISLHGENLVEQMVVSIFMVHKDNLIDFSKLEE
jgi:hypothetical protein